MSRVGRRIPIVPQGALKGVGNLAGKWNDNLRILDSLRYVKGLADLRFRLVDATGELLPYLAKEIAYILQGRDKPIYSPNKCHGDVVIVINASHVELPKDEWRTRRYKWFTGWPGYWGKNDVSAAEIWEKDPTALIHWEVRRCMPSNPTRFDRVRKLKVFAEADHPFKDFDLVPYIPRIRRFGEQQLGWLPPQGFTVANPRAYEYRLMRSSLSDPGPPATKAVLDLADMLTREELDALCAAAAADPASPAAELFPPDLAARKELGPAGDAQIPVLVR